MNVVKVMNNSLILAEDENGKEVVIMGKGVGFNHRPGDTLDMNKVQKIFVLKDKTTTQEYVRLIEETPSQYIDITNYIINYANEKLHGKLHDQIFVTLMDHISYALIRYKKNITIQNRLIWEVKKFYPKEFSIGVDAVEYINKTLGIHLPEAEAGNIAFHLVNAQTEDQDMKDTLLTVKMLKDILNIIQYHFDIQIDKDSLTYSRFFIHLQFFIQRLLDGKMMESDNTFIYNQIAKEYPEELKCSKLIGQYVKNLLNKGISNEELLYLTIHIVRIIQR